MDCATCPIIVKQSLMHVPGVHDARVSAVPPEAAVTYDPGLSPIEDLTDATARAGYPSSLKAEGGS
jgi:mercuric ion binding protein